MAKEHILLSENTEIVLGQGIALSEYRAFFEQSAAKEAVKRADFQYWLNTQTGKTLTEAVEDYFNAPENKNIIEYLKVIREFLHDALKMICFNF